MLQVLCSCKTDFYFLPLQRGEKKSGFIVEFRFWLGFFFFLNISLYVNKILEAGTLFNINFDIQAKSVVPLS